MADEFETEEQRIEALLKWWNDNKRSVITGLILGVVIVVGWNRWQAHQKEQAQEASAIYQKILSISLDNTKDATTEKLANQIINDYGSTAYSAFAALFLAKVKANAGDLPAAINSLQSALKQAPYDGFENLVRLRMLRILLAQSKAEEAIQVLASIDQEKSGKFEAQFEEIKGDALLQLRRPNEARTAYQRAEELGLKYGYLRMKLDDLAEPVAVVDVVK